MLYEILQSRFFASKSTLQPRESALRRGSKDTPKTRKGAEVDCLSNAMRQYVGPNSRIFVSADLPWPMDVP